jgi:hypothetical protein
MKDNVVHGFEVSRFLAGFDPWDGLFWVSAFEVALW